SRDTSWPRDWSSDVCSSDLSPAEDVTGPAAEEQQPGEGQGVGVDDPLQVGAREAERVLNVWQRDVDDRRVEDHHQLRGGNDGERSEERRVGKECRTAVEHGS